MTNPVTTLTCPSCGGKLQISDKINRFACGYCGNEQIVHRESGIVYLEPIAEDVRHIRIGVDNLRGGVDKTAAELAIARLTKELSDLEAELKTANTRDLYKWKQRPDGETALGVLSVFLFFVAINSRSLLVLIVFIACLSVFLYMWITRHGEAQKLKKEAIDDIQAEMSDVKAALTRNRKLV